MTAVDPARPARDKGSQGSRPGGLERIVPTRLRGPGRRPAWRRTRLRRVVSAACVAAAAGLAMSAYLPHQAPRGVPIVIVAQHLTAGHVLTQGDLAVADWPADLTPEGAEADPGALVGRSLGAGMSRGEPITAARLRGPGLLAGAQTGLVAAHVRLTDPAMAAMTTPGDHVDLISPAGRLVATNVAVLAVDAGPTGGGAWSATAESRQPAGVTVAVPSSTSVLLATADPSGLTDLTFSLVMRAPAT